MNEIKYTDVSSFQNDKRVWSQLIQSIKDNSTPENRMSVIISSSSFGDTPDELQIFGKRIKEIIVAGGDAIITV